MFTLPCARSLKEGCLEIRFGKHHLTWWVISPPHLWSDSFHLPPFCASGYLQVKQQKCVTLIIFSGWSWKLSEDEDSQCGLSLHFNTILIMYETINRPPCEFFTPIARAVPHYLTKLFCLDKPTAAIRSHWWHNAPIKKKCMACAVAAALLSHRPIHFLCAPLPHMQDYHITELWANHHPSLQWFDHVLVTV